MSEVLNKVCFKAQSTVCSVRGCPRRSCQYVTFQERNCDLTCRALSGWPATSLRTPRPLSFAQPDGPASVCVSHRFYRCALLILAASCMAAAAAAAPPSVWRTVAASVEVAVPPAALAGARAGVAAASVGRQGS